MKGQKSLGLKCLVLAVLLTSCMLCGGTAKAIPVYEGTYVDMYLKQNTFPSGLEEKQVYLDKAESKVITGHVGSQTGTPLVLFSSTTDTLDAKNGFAEIKAMDGNGINNLTITAPGYYFEDLIFSVNLAAQTSDFKLSVSPLDKSGGTESFQGWDLGSGENRILLLSNPGYLMQSVTINSVQGINSVGGLDQLKQTEISGLTAVPEPSTILLLGLGLVGLAGVGRKFQK